MFTASENGYGASFTHFSLGGKEIELNGGIAQSVVFDPSTPFIYLPEADFLLLKTEINIIFSNFRDVERFSICDKADG